MVIYAVVTVLLVAIYAWIVFSNTWNYFSNIDDKFVSYVEIFHLVHSFVLILTVIKMRHAIVSANLSSTNDKLVMIHAINFIVWCILGGINTVLMHLTNNEPSS